MKIIVAIPAFNEEQTVGDVISNLRKSTPKDVFTKILVVDDGSADKTSSVAKKAGVDYLVKHSVNSGVGVAYKTALDYALSFGADIICTIDGDRQFYPEQLEKLLDPILEGESDIVIGSRFLKKETARRVPLPNMICNRLMASFLSILLGMKFTDVESGFRALTRNAAKDLRLMGFGSFSHDMLLDLSFKGYRISEVPVNVRYFKNRRSRVIKGFLRYGIKSLISILFKLLTLHFSVTPSSLGITPTITVHKLELVDS